MNLLTPAEIAEDRLTAEANMPDTCRVTRAAAVGDAEYVDTSVLDENTGQYPTQGRHVVYEGRCRFQIKADINSNVVETTAGEREWTYLTSTLQTPIAASATEVGDPGAIRPDNVAESLTCPNDPSMVGRVFNIQGAISHKSQASHRRFRLREPVQ